MRELTERQRQAFEYLRDEGPVSSEELGAFLHSIRERKRHRPELRCDWCAQDGRQVILSLERRGLARGIGRGRPLWIAVDPAQLVIGDEPELSAFPEGY
jgi:hypothetical protein